MKKVLLLVLLITQTSLSAEYGVFMVVKGQVLIENVQSSLEAKVNSKVQVGDTVVTANDSRAKIVMSDRNIINISPNTRLKIEKYTNSGDDKNVHLNLIEGKVRNNVEQKYDNKNSKFEVRTATAVAGVRGTQFVTSYDKATRVTEVITIKGQVLFQNIAAGKNVPVTEPVVVGKGEKSQAQDGASPAPPAKVPEKEFRQIDSETSVKAKRPEDKAAQNAPVPQVAGDRAADKPPRPAGTELIDLNNGNTQIKDGTATRRFEKSKVRVITQPN